MIRHIIVCSYLGKAMFIYFISDTLKNNSLQSAIQLHSDDTLLITDYKNHYNNAVNYNKSSDSHPQLQSQSSITHTVDKCGSSGWEN